MKQLVDYEYYRTDLGVLYCGDCLETMKLMPDNSVDTIITDPPYGLSFMGKKWDYDVPSIETFQEMLRVAKHGATLLCFAGSRTQHRMACNVEDAGWVLKDCIMWLYGSGFPKATDISKQLDKNNGDMNRKQKFTSWMRSTGVTAKQIDAATGTFMGSHYTTHPTQPSVPTISLFNKIKRLIKHPIPDYINEIVKRVEAEREMISKHKQPAKEIYKGGELSKDVNITAPETHEAKLWNGWKSHGLKPAYEPILVAMKPNEGSYAENALKHGVSGLNIDGGRIPLGNEPNPTGSAKRIYVKNEYDKNAGYGENKTTPDAGRFPANIILEKTYIQLLTLIDNCDIIISKTIGGYYENYKVPDVWERVSDLSEQGGEVLQQEVLLQSSKKLSTTDERKETQQGITKENECSERQKSEVSGMVSQQGLQVYKSGGVEQKRIDNSKTDDNQKVNSGTQIGTGDETQQTTKEKRDSSPQERNKERQQNRELRNNKQYKSYSTSSQADKRKQTLEILITDVPKAWMRYFRPTGYSIIDPESSAKMLDEQSGELKSGKPCGRRNTEGGYNKKYGSIPVTGIGDKGGASRFFYCAKSSKQERGENNNHPTVKPIKLMEYLCTLTKTPTGGIVLDPFMGSGSTGIACERTGRKFIGIEKEIEYCDIAKKRIAKEANQGKLL